MLRSDHSTETMDASFLEHSMYCRSMAEIWSFSTQSEAEMATSRTLCSARLEML